MIIKQEFADRADSCFCQENSQASNIWLLCRESRFTMREWRGSLFGRQAESAKAYPYRWLYGTSPPEAHRQADRGINALLTYGTFFVTCDKTRDVTRDGM